MAESTIWVHGTSLATETLTDITDNSRMGWGADVSATAGENAWLHASIPIAIPASSRVAVRGVYVRFFVEMGTLRDVHIYDGSKLVQKFDGLLLDGEHRAKDTKANTFTLPRAHVLASGLGVSLRFNASHNMGSGVQPRFIVAAVGARIATPPFSLTGFAETIRSRVVALVGRFVGAVRHRPDEM